MATQPGEMGRGRGGVLFVTASRTSSRSVLFSYARHPVTECVTCGGSFDIPLYKCGPLSGATLSNRFPDEENPCSIVMNRVSFTNLRYLSVRPFQRSVCSCIPKSESRLHLKANKVVEALQSADLSESAANLSAAPLILTA